MKPLWPRWAEIQTRLRPAGDTLWLFDYDGTLTPIVRHPNLAVLSPEVRNRLDLLVRRFPRRVGVLSGRSLKTLKEMVGLKGMMYGGAHGFEIQGPGVRFQYKVSQARLKRLDLFARHLRETFSAVPGARVENKRWTIAAHYREVKPKDLSKVYALLSAARKTARGMGFTVMHGLSVMEFFSDGHCSKGRAVQWLRKHLGVRRVLFVGDDATDETAFRVMRNPDVSIHVGNSPKSAAMYGLRKQTELPLLLERILTL